jgi:hypothetical protein
MNKVRVFAFELPSVIVILDIYSHDRYLHVHFVSGPIFTILFCDVVEFK